jgi:quinohemoprotein ethanol dehydrogenase
MFAHKINIQPVGNVVSPFRIVVALLIAISMCDCGRPDPAVTKTATQSIDGQIDKSRRVNSIKESIDWITSGGDQAGTYYSPLAIINDRSVNELGFAWDYALGTSRGLEATPIVVDGMMFASGNFGRVYALNAVTGNEKWTYYPDIDGQWARYACCDAVNRGLVVWKGRVYVGALDGWLHAIDAKTGKRIWKVDTLIARDQHQPYTLPGAPLIAGNLIVIGNAGGDFKGVRGYISAYDLESGTLKWRFFTVPRDPKLGPQDQPHLKSAVMTWDPKQRWEFGGGAAVWDGMSYDPDLHLIYIGTGNASPYSTREEGQHRGDDLYSASIVAIHAETGQMAWYYQTVPGDEWDFDSTQKMILADVPVGDVIRRVLFQAAKNGYFYVLDRVTGELVSAEKFAFVNWTIGLDPKTGRPTISPDAEYLKGPKLIAPSMAGAHSWQPMSYDKDTGLVYIPTIEAAMVYIDTDRRPSGLIEGSFTVAGIFPEGYDPKGMSSLFGPLPALKDLAKANPAVAANSRGVLRAWDPIRKRIAWEHALQTAWNGGVLSTAGNLVIQGDATGVLTAYTADSGQVLKRIETGTSIMAAPMTYEIAGRQYLAVMAGYGGATGLSYAYPSNTAAYKYGNAGRIIVLTLGGKDVPRPTEFADRTLTQIPQSEGTAQGIAHGEILYNRFCARCHIFGRGVLPDLRRLSVATHQLFYEIVLHGLYQSNGMARWDDVLSRSDAEDIHAYLVNQTRDASAELLERPRSKHP